jgi:site-specific DNA recombinase
LPGTLPQQPKVREINIKEHVLTTENLTGLVKVVNEEMDGLALEYRRRLDSVIVEITDVERRLGKLYDAIETGQIRLTDLSPRIQQLKSN